MSTSSGLGNKVDKNKGKFKAIEINKTYKGTSVEPQRTAGIVLRVVFYVTSLQCSCFCLILVYTRRWCFNHGFWKVLDIVWWNWIIYVLWSLVHGIRLLKVIVRSTVGYNILYVVLCDAEEEIESFDILQGQVETITSIKKLFFLWLWVNGLK